MVTATAPGPRPHAAWLSLPGGPFPLYTLAANHFNSIYKSTTMFGQASIALRVPTAMEFVNVLMLVCVAAAVAGAVFADVAGFYFGTAKLRFH